MKKFFLKLLLKLIGEDPFALASCDVKKMQNWLYSSYNNDGHKQYYTIRKKYIQNEMTIGMEEKEYWKRIGKIEELRLLNENILKESIRRKEENEKNNKQLS